jgi:hypothetical protein
MLKFTVRDLFSRVTIVALCLGWAVDHWQHSEVALRNKNHLLEYRTLLLKRELERLGVKVTITETSISTLAPNGQSMCARKICFGASDLRRLITAPFVLRSGQPGQAKPLCLAWRHDHPRQAFMFSKAMIRATIVHGNV